VSKASVLTNYLILLVALEFFVLADDTVADRHHDDVSARKHQIADRQTQCLLSQAILLRVLRHCLVGEHGKVEVVDPVGHAGLLLNESFNVLHNDARRYAYQYRLHEVHDV